MTAPIKVLCVDDNRDAAESTAEILELAGCETRVCFDGTTAVAAAQEFAPDVCVIDVTMPGIDGLQLARFLRNWVVEPEVRLIALTGLWDVTSTHNTRNAGFDEHVVKSSPPDRLIRLVTAARPEPVGV